MKSARAAALVVLLSFSATACGPSEKILQPRVVARYALVPACESNAGAEVWRLDRFTGEVCRFQSSGSGTEQVACSEPRWPR